MTAFDFRLEAIDAAIHFGKPDWPGGELALLRHEIVLPACSPHCLSAIRSPSQATCEKPPSSI